MKSMLLVVALLLDFGNFALMPPVKKEDNVRRCMKRIIDIYADNATTVLSMYRSKSNGNFIPHSMQIPIININMNQKLYNVNYQIYKELVIIDPEDFDFDLMVKLGFWNEIDLLKRKFVFTWPLMYYKYVNKLFEYLWKQDIPDAIVLVYDYSLRSNFTEVLIGDRLHPMSSCGTAVANISRFSCDQIKKNKQKFFKNYSKCNLTYYYETNLQEVKTELNYIMKFVLSEIVAILNLTFNAKHIEDNSTTGENYFLVLYNIRSCYSDDYFCGVMFTKETTAWTVPSPKKLGSLEVFKLIFKWNTWIMIFLSFIVTSTAWWTISTCKHTTSFVSVVLNVYSITLTGATNNVPKCFSLRCLFFTYVIYSIHIQTGFTSNLVQLLTIPQYSVIKTIEELVDSNLPILVPNCTADFIFNMSHEGNKVFERLKSNILVLSEAEWSHKSLNYPQFLENCSFMTSVDNAYIMSAHLDIKVHVITDETLIKNELYALASRQGSYIITDVNKIINILIESGLIDYKKIVFKRITENYTAFHKEMEHSSDTTVLGMKHVYPIFVFWTVGLFIATLAFFLECATYVIKNN